MECVTDTCVAVALGGRRLSQRKLLSAKGEAFMKDLSSAHLRLELRTVRAL